MAADTDNVADLVSQLLNKLAALDTQVQLYRQDMAQQFQRHSRELLEDVPKDVASQVEQAVADSLQNYTALNPGFSDLASQQQSEQVVDPIERIELDRRARVGSRSPPPVLPHTSGVPPEQSGPRSPHEREREFHGLFTPSYLPLLEAEPSRNWTQKKNHHQTSYTSTSTSITPPASISPSSSSSPLPKSDRKLDNVDSNQFKDFSNPSTSSLATVATLRPDPIRRHTEETLSSVTSDDSALRSRPRSALRRSSSSSTRTGPAQSPRRVRFEVEGGEVLPTASPMLSPRISDQPPSPLNSTSNMDGELEDETQLPPGLGDLNMDLPESDLLGSSPPRPKKVSSTDRLKAMTRNSTEDTSKWYTVGDLQGSDDDEDELVMGGGRSGRQRGAMTQAATTSQAALHAVTQTPTAHRINDSRMPSQLSPGLPVVQERDETIHSEEDEDSSDSDALKMPSRSKGPKSPIASKFAAPPPKADPSTTASTNKTSSTSGTAAQTESPVDEEDMFDFDEDGHESPSAESKLRPSSKYIEEEEDHDDIEEPSTPTGKLRNGPPASLSQSVNITRTPPPPKSPTSGVISGITSGIAASMGSYKGRPFMIGSIKNEQLHEQASKMGNFNSFVGSVDGRTGVDEKGSYRPDGLSFKGTPKSLSERMLKEELEEEEAAQRNEAVISEKEAILEERA